MADIDFLALIEQGVDAWNQWRLAHPNERPNLSQSYLYGQTLAGFNLSGVDFERACLIGADLTSANLSGARLVSVYASSSRFTQANLTGADLSQGSFPEADFSGADLSAANVQAAEFAGATFTGACFAAIRASQRTSFSDAQGQHLYIQLPPAGRCPQVGNFQAGELAAFLQQQFLPVSTPVSTPLFSSNRADIHREGAFVAISILIRERLGSLLPLLKEWSDALRSFTGYAIRYIAARSIVVGRATVEISGLFLDWLIKQTNRTRRRLVVVSQQANRWLRTELIPTAKQDWLSTRRFVRYWLLHGRRKSRRLGQQLQQRGVRGYRVYRWYRRRQWRRFNRGRVRTYLLAQERLQNEVLPACRNKSALVLSRLQLQKMLALRFLTELARLSSATLSSAKTQLRAMWADFLLGKSLFQRRLTSAHQSLRRAFIALSERMQVVAFRQTERFYAWGLVCEQYGQLVFSIAREQLQQSKYLQSVTADLRKEYRRYPLPLAVGFVGAIAIMLLNPVARSTRSDSVTDLPPIEASTESKLSESTSQSVEEQAAHPSAPTAVPKTAPQSSRVLRDPQSVEASMANSTDITLPTQSVSNSSPARFDQATLTGISATALPCPALSEDYSKTLPAYSYQDGSSYYGEVVDGQPADGKGTMMYPTGNRYDGEYRNGWREGCGMFSFSDGRRYVGQFKADQFSGLGTWILENGERYIGEFENNKCNGQGSFIYANGTVKSGVWRNGTLTDSSLSCEWGSLQVPTSADN